MSKLSEIRQEERKNYIVEPAEFLRDLFMVGLAAADPLKTVPPHLPAPPKGRTIVIGAGKAAAAMAKAVEDHWPSDNIEGLVVTRYDYGQSTRKIEVLEAAHPVPDDAGETACRMIFKKLEGLNRDDLVLALMSGGGSALLSAPAPCLSSAEKRTLNKALLKSGATIHEMNCVRKHLSAVKGGRLALASAPAKLVTLVISDVPGDDPRTVASGPTLPDPTTQVQAQAIIDRYQIPVSAAVRAWLQDNAHETPKPDNKAFIDHEVRVISSAKDALAAAADFATKSGVTPLILGDDLEGEARTVGQEHMAKALKLAEMAPCLLLSGGETTVTVKGNGKGGRNAEYLLAAMIAAQGSPRVYGLACDTDGIDGSENNAGAFFTPAMWQAARSLGLDAQAYLDNNDAYSFFEKLGGLIVTGPTCTNVNDFRAILVL
ncbi:MAG: glycerate kinase [Micavibrio aeruginosavorus]|uniref:Glycerate kinase n=1 Tax=Micavibrio aeruginosavorus TaxID=349221 RepID=A0A7T5UH31_9BACT|nr:MAG: glycerate kinase [Micavibrio aeruginosavorus]